MLLIRKNKVTLIYAISLIIMTTTTGCMSFKNIPVTRIYNLKERKNILRVHCNDSLWILNKFTIDENITTGVISGKKESYPLRRIIDVYVAPSEAIKVEDNLLSFSTKNIGKVDYPIRDRMQMTAGITLGFLFIVFPVIMSFF